MPEIFLALSKHEVKVGSTITVQVSGLLPPLPYEIWVNETQWYKSASNYTENIRHHNYQANEIGIFDFYVLMYYPLMPPIIYSNHESLAVLEFEPNGNGTNGNGTNGNGQQNIGIILAFFFFIFIIAALYGRQK